MQSTEKCDSRTVSIRAEIWHALLEIAGWQIDPETAEVCSMHARWSIHTAFIQICQMGMIASDVAISPELLEAGCGSNLEIRLRQLARRSGCGHAIGIYLTTTKCFSEE